MLSRTLLVVGFAAAGFARSVPHRIARQEPSSTVSAPDTRSTICGDIIDAVNEGYQIFAASDAYECLTSVPFNAAVASRFVRYWNETLQFQSTLVYLKNPPEGYQQPAIDVVAEFGKLEQRILDGAYKNQYDFEADLQLLIYAVKDGHVALTAGVLSAFSFASPFEIISVSADGKQVPKIYITLDYLQSTFQDYTPSAIATINGTEVNEFLTTFAALNSWGYVESHAEWNELMSHPTLDIQGGLTTFSGGGTFYPGDTLTITFENGTDPLELSWLAVYNEPANATGPLTTGGDFYNYFVLGFLPDSFNDTQGALDSTGDDELTATVPTAPGNWYNASGGAFPADPDIVQAELGLYFEGLVSGYFYKESSTGVLSIPSFDAVPQSIGNFSDALADFVRNASAAGMDKVVIDLQHNLGGSTSLAYLAFKVFFPDLMPFGGSRRRSFEMANTLGSARTEWWNALDEDDVADKNTKFDYAANEWVITDRLNAATGKNFTSWNEYQGPQFANGDSFSLVEQYDLTNPTFETAAFDQWSLTMYKPNKTEWPFLERTWEPEKIVLLSDGLCGSTCALFMEMMTHAGVKTVVAGGRPVSGPMQAASGNRGATAYSTFALDDEMDFARSIDDRVTVNVNATIPEVRDEAIYTKYGGFNLRDQIREGETTPLQFKYQAADCRIYYTFANIYNMTRLWHDVATAAFEDQSLCVEGSQGFSSTNTTSTKAPPKPAAQEPILSLNSTSVRQAGWDEDDFDGLKNGRGRARGGSEIRRCPANNVCGIGFACKQVSVTCAGGGTSTVFACLPACQNGEQCIGTCALSSASESKRQVFRATAGGAPQYQTKLSTGFCYPKQGTKALGCAYDPVSARL